MKTPKELFAAIPHDELTTLVRAIVRVENRHRAVLAVTRHETQGDPDVYADTLTAFILNDYNL